MESYTLESGEILSISQENNTMYIDVFKSESSDTPYRTIEWHNEGFIINE